jgi:serine/threonine-protein kinase
VQLVQASSGTVVWSETYDREIKDIFELQEDVAGAVVEALKLRLLPSEHIPSSERTANAQAYEQYLQGLKYNKESQTVDDMRRAMGAFEKAVALDPNYASGYARIALVAAEIAGETVDGALYEVSRSNAERAMALSPRLDLAYIARARVRMYNDWDFTGTKQDLDTALGIDPNNSRVQDLQINYLLAIDKAPEALAVQKRVVERNPLYAGAWSNLANIYMRMRDYANAREALKRADQVEKGKWGKEEFRSGLELYAGNYTEALGQARMVKDPHHRDYAVSMAAWSAGEKDEARAALGRLIAEVPDIFAAQIAEASAWQGDREQAYHWLDHALELRDPGLIALPFRPAFDKIRGEPRFQRLLQKINSPR